MGDAQGKPKKKVTIVDCGQSGGSTPASIAASLSSNKAKGPAKQPKQAGNAEKAKEAPLRGKDKVKQQRLAGQSGIGSDFKEWKSEEEMRMRQQFD